MDSLESKFYNGAILQAKEVSSVSQWIKFHATERDYPTKYLQQAS
jgi:hypothetical protein